ncbi:MAG: hypothetical protein ACK4M7_06240, partial [Burkholderiales bacterium]
AQSISNNSRSLPSKKPILIEEEQYSSKHCPQFNSSLYTRLKDQVCIVQDGYQVKFEEQASGILQAIVEHAHFKGISTRVLPVVVGPELAYAEAPVSNSTWQKYHIHVMSDHVYVGSRGLKGGMKRKLKDGTKEVEENKKKPKATTNNNNKGSNLGKSIPHSSKNEEIISKKDKDTAENKNTINKQQSDLNTLCNQLLNITTQDIKSTVSNSWSTGEEINQVLDHILQDRVHLLHPNLFSIDSPADSNQTSARDGAVNYVEAIQERINKDDGNLRKPIIAIINTQSAGPSYNNNPTKEGG